MADIEMGRKVDTLALRIVSGDGFWCQLVSSDNWTSTPTLYFAGGQTWVPYVEDNKATFDIGPDDTALIQDHERVVLMLGELTWARGRVEVI